jgi:hypothetical protein
MKVVVYVKHHRGDGEMRICLDDDVKSRKIAEAIVRREKARFKDEPKMLRIRRWEIEGILIPPLAT